VAVAVARLIAGGAAMHVDLRGRKRAGRKGSPLQLRQKGIVQGVELFYQRGVSFRLSVVAREPVLRVNEAPGKVRWRLFNPQFEFGRNAVLVRDGLDRGERFAELLAE